MLDFASSENPEVQAQLARLAALSLPQGRFGLETIRELLNRLGDPHQYIPPAFHVAGTNGKGSVCAYLRAMLEAQGLQVHATTSPHLVRYNERIRIAGKLVEDAELAALLEEVLNQAGDLSISFFEATIAASFLAFARHPADACVIETGLGGRFDATNVLANPAACGIATIGVDHEQFLLAPEAGTPNEPLARIAFEKAGIIKRGCPVATFAHSRGAEEEIIHAASNMRAPLFMRGRDWHARLGEMMEYRDGQGSLKLPLPTLPGIHQAENAALAVAMVRHQERVLVTPQAMAEGIGAARWPARLQRLAQGPVAQGAPGHEIWLDGGHNPDAGLAIARHFSDQRLHLIAGMLAGKQPDAIAGPLRAQLASLQIVQVPGHDSHTASAFGKTAEAAKTVEAALADLPGDNLPVLIAGSLYLAGHVLRRNGEIPD